MIDIDAKVAAATTLQEKGDFPAALTLLGESLQARPGDPAILLALARLSAAMGAPLDALTLIDLVLEAVPGDFQARLERATLIDQLGRSDEAGALLRELACERPGDPATLLKLSFHLRRESDPVSGHAVSLAGAAAAPEQPAIWISLGISHHNQGRLDSAMRCFDRALAIDPGNAKAHFSLASSLLAGGRWREGFVRFPWRRQLPEAGPAPAGLPPAGIESRRLLLWNDQGLGDALQFLRYVPLLRSRGYEPVLRLPATLLRLARAIAGSPETHEDKGTPPAADGHLPLMDIPDFLGLEAIPSEVPYLTPDPAAAEVWAKRLAPLPGLKVGLVWAGAARAGNFQMASIDRRRSVQLSDLAPVLEVPGACFVSLQLGGSPPAGLIDAMAEVTDFADTAAVVAALDLVISVDTSVAHLAGALGKPVWILSRYDGCWRWLRDRADSPWYPTARLFRQTVPGDWTPVIAEVAAALGELVAARL